MPYRFTSTALRPSSAGRTSAPGANSNMSATAA
jgi:hypothetical protein